MWFFAIRYERHERKLLNFGHTLAHGIEAASQPINGATAMRLRSGMAAIARWSAAEGWMSTDDARSH